MKYVRYLLILTITLATIFSLALVSNFIIQIYKKPLEIMSFIVPTKVKTISQTWNEYGEYFKNSSTDLISPALLAAIAQKESSGDPLASPRWKFDLNKPLTRIYSPPTTAFGLMQMTDPNFYDSSKLCFRTAQSSGYKTFDSCGRIPLSSRAFPAHSIYLTARTLTYQLKRVLKGSGRKAAQQHDIDTLASITHLCGVKKGWRFARSNFNINKVGRCGAHNPINYVRDIKRLKRKFNLLSGRDRDTVDIFGM